MQHCLCELIETEIEYSKSPWPPLIRGRCWYAAPARPAISSSTC